MQDQLRGVKQIEATLTAFAAVLDDGSVVTWGNAEKGGDSSDVEERLKDVQQIQSAGFAFRCHSVRRVCCDLG